MTLRFTTLFSAMCLAFMVSQLSSAELVFSVPSIDTENKTVTMKARNSHTETLRGRILLTMYADEKGALSEGRQLVLNLEVGPGDLSQTISYQELWAIGQNGGLVTAAIRWPLLNPPGPTAGSGILRKWKSPPEIGRQHRWPSTEGDIP